MRAAYEWMLSKTTCLSNLDPQKSLSKNPARFTLRSVVINVFEPDDGLKLITDDVRSDSIVVIGFLCFLFAIININESVLLFYAYFCCFAT